MLKKWPEFNGPLVNSWPGRLLTLEIARFSLIFGPLKKCQNHYFCSTILLAYTEPLKLDPPKRGSKNFAVDQALSKRCPGPLFFLFLSSKNRGRLGFQIFVFSIFGPFFTRRCSFRRRKITLKVLWNSEGVAKTGKNKDFWLSRDCFCLSLWSPHGHLSSSYALFFANVSFILVFLLSVFCLSSSWWLCSVYCFHLCLYCVIYC